MKNYIYTHEKPYSLILGSEYVAIISVPAEKQPSSYMENLLGVTKKKTIFLSFLFFFSLFEIVLTLVQAGVQ